jgi:hypothetical protein
MKRQAKLWTICSKVLGGKKMSIHEINEMIHDGVFDDLIIFLAVVFLFVLIVYPLQTIGVILGIVVLRLLWKLIKEIFVL